jgi:ferredoxin
MPRIKINQSMTIESDPTETLLEAMEHAGLAVEYQCRDGHCGACRCKLSAGNVEYTGFAMASTQQDEILPCICRSDGEFVELQEVRYQPETLYQAKTKRA